MLYPRIARLYRLLSTEPSNNRGENFHLKTQNGEIHESFLPRKFPAIYNMYTVSVNVLILCLYVQCTEGVGEIKYDIGYGGAFYAFVDAHQLNVDISHTPAAVLRQVADTISTAVKKGVKLQHPKSADLAFLYGTILTDGKDDYERFGEEVTHLCVFADCQVR